MKPLTIEETNKQQLELKYSYNPKITPKHSKKEAAEKSWGWKLTSVKWDEPSLTKMVQKRRTPCLNV